MDIKSFIFPMLNFYQFFILIYLILVEELDVSFIVDSINSLFNTSFGSYMIQALIEKIEILCKIPFQHLRELFQKAKDSVQEKKRLSPPLTKCINCDRILSLHNTSFVTVYGSINSKRMKIADFKCSQCSTFYSIDRFSIEKNFFFYPSIIEIKHFKISKITAFEVELLREYDEHLIRNGATFSGKNVNNNF